MTSDTEQTTEPHAVLEVEMRLYIPVPVASFEGYLDDAEPTLENIQDLRVDELRDVLLEDTDRLFDAITEKLEAGDDFIDINGVDDIEQRERPGPVEFYKPADGELYTLPVPNMISGNVIFTENGIEPVEVSNVNKLTDDQLEGAYYAARRIWGLRGMHRYQQEQMAEFLSEIQWAMLARPSRHVFKPMERCCELDHNADGDCPKHLAGRCDYCGGEPEGHLVREEKSNAG